MTSAAMAIPREAAPTPARLRVLYVVSLFPCWSETFIVREIRALIASGVDVQIVSLRHASEALVQSDARALLDRVTYPASGWRAAAAVLRELMSAPWTHAAFLAALLGALWRRPLELAKSSVTWWRTAALLPRARQIAPDVVHAHWATYPSTAALLLSRSLGVPFGFTAHAHDIFVHDHLLREKLRAARFAVTISEFNGADLARRFGPESVKRLHVVHCGLALPEFAFRRAGREPGALLGIGRLDAIKGFPVLVEACAILRDEGVSFRCDVIGEGELRGELERLVAARGLSDRVRLVGALPQEDVRARLDRATLFVLPSVVTPDGNKDGVPVALMEAMAVGLPVVSTTVSGIPELVRDGWSGLLVEPGNARALAAAIRSLLDDPALGECLAGNARDSIERRFDVQAETARLRELFLAAAGDSR